MAWADPLSGGGYRAAYRDTERRKHYVKDADGHTVRYGRKTDARLAGAEAEANARRSAAAQAGALPASITWGQWWDILARDRTFEDTDTGPAERSIVEAHLRQKWGNVPLNKITFEQVDDWVRRGELRVRTGMSPGYVHKIYSLFNLSIKAAMKPPARILHASPCAGVELPKRRKKAKPYLSVATADAYRDRGQLREDYADALDFDLETGLRPGEICGLHADRLDLERGWMLVAEVFIPRRRIIRPFPKDADARMVPLTPAAIEVVRRRLADRDLGSGCGLPHSDGSACQSTLVFRTMRHRPMHPTTMRYNLGAAAKRAKVERRTPYAGRRGFATRAAEGGLDAFQIAEILGHATLEQAQEYVQQTPAARMKLSAALARYPQLVVIEGEGLGHAESDGAEDGATSREQPPRSAAIRRPRDTG